HGSFARLRRMPARSRILLPAALALVRMAGDIRSARAAVVVQPDCTPKAAARARALDALTLLPGHDLLHRRAGDNNPAAIRSVDDLSADAQLPTDLFADGAGRRGAAWRIAAEDSSSALDRPVPASVPRNEL